MSLANSGWEDGEIYEDLLFTHNSRSPDVGVEIRLKLKDVHDIIDI